MHTEYIKIPIIYIYIYIYIVVQVKVKYWTSWLHRASNDVERFYLPIDTHNAEKRRVIKTF